ncbi:sodium:solute symporter [Bacillaceae bacterium SAS-127]|nr:sodium:solute symporter [Bacillaceae bacterium SAS-127]
MVERLYRKCDANDFSRLAISFSFKEKGASFLKAALAAKQEAVVLAEAAKQRPAWVVPLVLISLLELFLLFATSMTMEAKWSLFSFGCAIILWTTTSLNSAYVALGVVLFLVVTGTAKQELLFESLASDVIWLMIGSFILGGALQVTGLAEKLTNLVISRAKNVTSLFTLLTIVVQLLAFFIPSTSGRAAVLLPVFHSLTTEIGSRRLTKAMAILLPTIILVSTSSTMIGAGSHFIALDMLKEFSGKEISFIEWLLWGLPFGIVASFLSCRIVLFLFLNKQERKLPLVSEKIALTLSRNEKYTVAVIAAMVIFWVTERLHGIEIATVTVIGAFLLTLPNVGVMKWKEGVQAVSWNLIIFVGAAIALGKSLIESGAAEWVMGRFFSVTDQLSGESTFPLLFVIIILSLTSHLYITSHTTRAVIFVPPLLYLASSLQVNEVAVLFIGIVGMNYCLTFPVSSKALLMFQEGSKETFQPRDLLRLSLYVGFVHLILMIVFYYVYWQWVGLSL